MRRGIEHYELQAAPSRQMLSSPALDDATADVVTLHTAAAQVCHDVGNALASIPMDAISPWVDGDEFEDNSGCTVDMPPDELRACLKRIHDALQVLRAAMKVDGKAAP